MHMTSSKTKILVYSALGVAIVVGAAFLYQTGKFTEWFGGAPKADGAAKKRELPKLIELDNGEIGLELSNAAIEALELKPKEAMLAHDYVPLPPMIGTVNYDNDRLFAIKPRFTGEIAEVKSVAGVEEVIKNGSPTYKECKRPIKFGDKVKQGDVLAVVWSRDLGEKKAALVDAISNLLLSEETLERQHALYLEGAISLAALNLGRNKLQVDKNAVWTAERTLRIWKLTDEDIKAIKDEAKMILEKKADRDIVDEVQRWARVEIKVPWFDAAHPNRLLTILEKNTNLTDMVDPANYTTPLFRVADLSRLQIWVHPPEEYLPMLRQQLKLGPRALKWSIRFQAEAAKMKPLELPVDQISFALEPNQHTPMLLGYLDNPEYKYLIGQFVTATILARPPADTVEVPTDAVNPLSGQEFVFVENPDAKNQFLIRRVSVEQSLQKISYVRTKLTPEQEQINLDVKDRGYKIQPLNPGDRVVTRGVVELTAALEELRSAKKATK
jgi:membrane fusion protein, heavy metal efflux system